MKEEATRRIREAIAKLLGVEEGNLKEEETRKALQRISMRKNARMRKARDEVTKKLDP